ncbi:MAG: response regulator [bacterium]
MKILVVDDSKAMRMIVRRALRQAGFDGHSVEEASDGKEALAAIQRSRPDVVLTDWNMPEMTGIEMLEALREQNIDVRVGFVTSQSTPEMVQRARDAGALFLLAKPFTPDRFKAVLEPVLQ